MSMDISPVYTDAPEPWRRLACALLLDGALGAHKRDEEDVEWVNSDFAKRLADSVDLPLWPPVAGELAARGELKRRAASRPRAAEEPLGPLSIPYMQEQMRKKDKLAQAVLASAAAPMTADKT